MHLSGKFVASPLHSFDMRKLLITSFILSKIDYGNSTLVGLSAYRLELQRVINAAAKIINNKGNMTMSLLEEDLLHDLPLAAHSPKN